MKITYELGNIIIYTISMEECKPSHNYTVKWNNQYLIHYVLSGKGVFVCDGKEYKLSAGNAFLIGNKKGYYEADKNEPWTYSWINVSGDAARRFFTLTGLSVDEPVYKTKHPEIIADYFLKLNKLYSNCKKTDEFKLLSLLFETFDKMIETNEKFITASINSSALDYINICKEFIDINYYRKISMSELCKVAGLEYSYLFRLFKAELNISPGNYIINRKLSKAAELLRNNMSVTEAALSVGYPDRLAFSKLFSKKYGKSPQTYRMENRDN